MTFPLTRGRRLRSSPQLRRLISDIRVDADMCVMPLFIGENQKKDREISSLPGIFQFSCDSALKEIEVLKKAGLQTVLLFGIPGNKDEQGSQAYAEQGIVQKALRAIKKNFPDLLVITDLCLCGYTSHGHCGVLRENKEVDNDETLRVLAEIAVSQARAGADMVAPSAMMDGQVRAIREGLDKAGFSTTPIMAYSAKYASSFYGPFREAADSAPQYGDRRSYQMDIGVSREALREIALDLEEGADIIMVKPGLCYLDVIKESHQAFNAPLAVYNVSGEYSMVKAAAARGWLEEKAAVKEILYAFKRAGADILITYFAKNVAQWIKDGQW